MSIRVKFFTLFLFLSVVLGAGIIIPSYLKIKLLELNDSMKYLQDANLELVKDIERNIQILEKSGVSNIDAYINKSKEDLILRYKRHSPDDKSSTFILDTQNNILLSHTKPEQRLSDADIISLLEQSKLGNTKLVGKSRSWLFDTQSFDEWNWQLLTIIPKQIVHQESRRYLRYVILISTLIFLFVLAIFMILSGQIQRRITSTSSHLLKYQGGRVNQRLESNKHDELGLLNRSINQMLNNIEQEISSRKQVEEELQKSKVLAERANFAKSEFLANVSHEIRNPITAVMGFSEMLAKTELTEKQQQFVSNINHASNNLTALLNEILDLSKIELGIISLSPSLFDARKEISLTCDLYALQAKQKNLAINYKIADDVPQTIFGDKARCSQIIGNLIHNAIKFTNEGSILLTVKLHQETSTSYHLLFEVIDNGVGIAKEDLSNIFNEFSQVEATQNPEYSGAGLGLAIVKRLLAKMKGSITLTSAPGRGSKFSVLIPFEKHSVQTKPNSTTNAPRLEEVALNAMKILCVDDDILNREFVTEILSNERITCSTATNGKEAIESLKTNRVDLILMDIRMPEMNGEEAIEFIRAHLPTPIRSVPIIALTANAFESDVKRYLALGANSFLSKPFNSDQLIREITQVLCAK